MVVSYPIEENQMDKSTENTMDTGFLFRVLYNTKNILPNSGPFLGPQDSMAQHVYSAPQTGHMGRFVTKVVHAIMGTQKGPLFSQPTSFYILKNPMIP